MIGLSESGKQRGETATWEFITMLILCESDGTTYEALVMRVEEQPLVVRNSQ